MTTAQVVAEGTHIIELAQELPPEDQSGRNPDIEQELTQRFHVDWTWHPAIKASGFDLEKSLHNQARFDPLDQGTVGTYTDAVKRGDKFPPVIAYRPAPRARYVMVDGNHRLASHAAADRPLDVYEIDKDTDPRTIALITFSMNTRHGRPTTEDERIQQGIWLTDNGASIDAAAAAVNIGTKALRKAIGRNRADQRADEVGLRRNEWDSLNVAVKTRLLNISTDEGFRAAANLAYAAHLTSDDMVDLVQLLNASRSGTRQEAIVKTHRDMYQDRIQGVGGGVMGKRQMGPKQRMMLALAQMMAIPDDNDVIIKTFAQPERAEVAHKMRTAGNRFHALANLLDPLKPR